MGLCVAKAGVDQRDAEFAEAHGLRYPGSHLECTLCMRTVARQQWKQHAASDAHRAAAAASAVDAQNVDAAILRGAAGAAAQCSRCSARFGCCLRATYCELCGVPCCAKCIPRQRKILTGGLRRVRACSRCQAPAPAARLLDTRAPVPGSCPAGECMSGSAPLELWQHVTSFLDYKELDASLQISHAFLRTLRLPFDHIDSWSDAFGRGTKLGSGSYGDVFRCYCKLPDVRREVAVKVIRKSGIIGLRRWRYLIREIDIQSQISHPNAIRLLGPKALQSHGQVYVIMELAGQDLFDRITRSGPLPEHEAVHLGRQLLGFVSDLHNAGVVHRDIKPENLLLTGPHDRPVLKVCDFGFARFVDSCRPSASEDKEQPVEGSPRRSESCGVTTSPVSAQTTAENGSGQPQGAENGYGRAGRVGEPAMSLHGGRACHGLREDLYAADAPRHDGLRGMTPCGTYGFAPPEMITALREQQTKAWLRDMHVFGLDIFGAGVVLHVMLTAHDPFPISDAGRHLQAVERGLKLSHPIYRHVSQGAISLIQRMLAFDPTERPSAAEVLCSPWMSRQDPRAEAPPVLPGESGGSRSMSRPSKALIKRGRHTGLPFSMKENGIIVLAGGSGSHGSWELGRVPATPERFSQFIFAAKGSFGRQENLGLPGTQRSLLSSGGSLAAPPIATGGATDRHKVTTPIDYARTGDMLLKPIDYLPSPNAGPASAGGVSSEHEHSVPLFNMD